ncbi:HAD family hydrolase [Shimazuella kribbensis]|uniref:HAD family hydrolase n=1 Tax=Shimazuella kribbensis TaxID=139808 RepID=UPI000401A3E4|nr:HAD family hydrolase [Shimazuella kribbensis]
MYTLNDKFGCFEGKRLILFDLDGPIAMQPKGHKSARLDEDERYVQLLGDYPLTHPHELLVKLVKEENPVLQDVERLVTSKERLSAESAILTPLAKEFVETLEQLHFGLAVTSNGSIEAVDRFLEKNSVTSFGEHVYTRTSDRILLKPDPDCIQRAIANTGIAASDSLMIGDSWSDVVAAKSAGVAFLGFAWTEEKKQELLEAGAQLLVSSWEELLRQR